MKKSIAAKFGNKRKGLKRTGSESECEICDEDRRFMLTFPFDQ